MPGAVDVSDAVAATGNSLLMKSKATLYSSQGMLTGLLTLHHDRLVWNEISDRSSNMLTISTDVLFGATLSPPGKYKFRSIEAASATNLSIETSTHFTVYTLTTRESGKRPLCDTWTFMVESEEESVTWLSLLRFAINPKHANGDANVLVFLNPVSGKRKSLKLFETVIRPIFEIGCTEYTLKVTSSSGHASEFARNEDLSGYTAIVAVSGDGLLHEILNGLLLRPDWSKYRNIPLGIIPTGTGNGLAKSLDCIWPEQAAVAIVKAQKRPIDIMCATLASGHVEYCFLSMTWGLIADIDIESERMRWAGPARLDLYGTIRLMNLRYYGGRLHYLPATVEPDSEDNQESSKEKVVDRKGKQPDRGGMVSGADAIRGAGGPAPSAGSSFTNMLDRANQGADMAWGLPAPNYSSPLIRQSPRPHSDASSPNVQQAATLHPTLTAGIQLPIKQGSLPPRWRTVEGPFVQVIATNVSWLSADFLACQRARISDGAIDLVYSGAATKWQIIPYMATSTRDNYMNTEGITHVRARAFILEPTGLRTTSRGITSLQAIQPRQGQPKATKDSIRPMSMPLFSSLRSKAHSKHSGSRAEKSASPQAPVPVRVRSHAYTSYHQQTIGRDSTINSLLVEGLDSAEAGQHSSGGVMARQPRTPAQAVFSVRSETDMAATGLSDLESSATLSAPVVTKPAQPSPITHSPIPEPPPSAPANGKVAIEQGARKSMDVGRVTDAEDSSDECKLVGTHGIVDLDGEVVELGAIKMECLPNLTMVICPPWLNESQTARVSTMPVPKMAESIKGTLSREGSMLSFGI
ncbi:Sphingosine kinase 1 [Coemansia sp. RSA 552]|nr:Sphingosine kinase 1 [Coemansia sp. RSA 552]